jgi:hypothetical protein
MKTLRDVFTQKVRRTSVLFAAVPLFMTGLITPSRASVPFTSATVTKVENRVSYGQHRGANSVTRQATVSDIVRANNFLLSEADSRAELQYPDGTLVRIGQNTVFTFDSDSRTLSLEKGTMIFHMPKGNGGGTIKTPSLTAAITGTTGKVSPNIIAIIEGVVKLVPSGRLIHGGEFARKNADGTITVGFFDPAHANDGMLVTFNGLMPGFEQFEEEHPKFELRDLRYLEVQERTQNLPGSVFRFFPEPIDRVRTKVHVPRPNSNNDRPITNY